ncbi:MAG: flagellar export protein FliJ [Sulfurospirillaceae bacterium]|jgi:flagellar biosynthesis chaperone FliJ|nr:flagellar export protein FliJ [Sulfurospirillaceae bacterium]MCK9546359.1 flagellar export protein FliJ [Sulfurospirillaceae bacterium]MDY0237378.1 flagellar export protein FliJ [Campylobacterales bacterium]
MHKKYGAVVKLKKQTLEQKESDLLQARTIVKKIEEDIGKITKDIKGLNAPKEGTYNSFLQIRNLGNDLMKQKEYLLLKKDNAQNQANKCLYLYNEALKEYEKMKYLKEEHYSKLLKEIKQKEQKELDEIALQLFFLQGVSR